MPKIFSLAGLVEATVDRHKHNVSFVLKMEDGRGLAFAANAPVARQIATSLGRVALEAGQSSPQMLSAEKVVQYGAKQDALGEGVLLQLVSEDGVPYMFGLPRSAAADLGARLQTEAGKASKTGRA